MIPVIIRSCGISDNPLHIIYVIYTLPSQLPLSARLQLPLNETPTEVSGYWVFLENLVIRNKGMELDKNPRGEEKGNIESKGKISGTKYTLEPKLHRVKVVQPIRSGPVAVAQSPGRSSRTQRCARRSISNGKRR